jgi:putative transposase
MAKLEHYYTKFEEGSFYHIYNRTVDKKPMFRDDGNYEYFLKRFNYYVSPVADTYAFCLLGNHFHILLRIRPFADLKNYAKLSNPALPSPPHPFADLTTFKKLSNLPTNLPTNLTTHGIVSHQFRKLFQSYAMAYNKQHNRVGTLFQTPFKRALVHNQIYLMNLVFYIHANPQHHNIINDFRQWKWSSFSRILLDTPSKLKKKEVIDWFGGRDNYQKYHEQQFRMLNNSITLEDG